MIYIISRTGHMTGNGARQWLDMGLKILTSHVN